MILQLTAPGMQCAEKTGQIPADMATVGGQRFDGIGRSLEHGIVAGALVHVDKSAQLFGNGEGDHKMMAGQSVFDAPVQPQVLFVVLAVGTVPVAAGAKHRVMLLALIPFKDSDAEMFAAAVANGVNGLALNHRHIESVLFDII